MKGSRRASLLGSGRWHIHSPESNPQVFRFKNKSFFLVLAYFY